MSRSRSLNKGDEVLVRAVHVEHPHDFYVRRLDDEDWIVTFQQFGEAHPSPIAFENSLELGQLVLVKHERHGWARAITVGGDNGKHSVRTLDYGDILHNLYPSQLFQLDWGNATPAKAIHCRLHLCEPKNGKIWSHSSINAFIDYMGKNPLKMTVMNRAPMGGQLVVELNSGWPETVSKLMVMAEAACFGGNNQQVNPLLPYLPVVPSKSPSSKQCYVYDLLEFGKESEVQILRVKNEKFNVIKLVRKEAFECMTDLLEAEFDGFECLQKIEAIVGTAVVCKSNRRVVDKFFRGEILNVKCRSSGNIKATVKLVDLGEEERVYVNKNTLRKCNSSLQELPVFVISCSLEESQKNLCKRLSPGLCLRVKPLKKSQTNDSYVVHVDVNSMSSSL